MQHFFKRGGLTSSQKEDFTAENVPYQRYIEQQPWFQVKGRDGRAHV